MTIVFISITSVLGQSVSVSKSWIKTVQRNGENGVEIHAVMDVSDMKGKTVGAYLYFFDSAKRPLVNVNAKNEYRAGNNNQLNVAIPLTCNYNVTRFNDVVFFIPFSQFPLSSGTANYYYHIKAYCSKWLSGGGNFFPVTITIPFKRSVVKTWKSVSKGSYTNHVQYNDGWQTIEFYWLSPNGWQKTHEEGHLQHSGRYGDLNNHYSVIYGYGSNEIKHNGHIITSEPARDGGLYWLIGNVSLSKDLKHIVVNGRTYNKMSESDISTLVNQLNRIPIPSPTGGGNSSGVRGNYGGGSNSGGYDSSGKRKCPVCNGTGDCSTCGGRGERRLGGDGQLVDCWSCNGTRKCQTCYGDGYKYR